MAITIIGAGSWGSAVAWLLGNKGYDVRLWARDARLVEQFNSTHSNPRYLNDVVFPPNVIAYTSLEKAISHAEAVVLAMPSAAVRDMALRLAPYIGGGMPVLLLSKGVERESGMLLLDVLEQVLGGHDRLVVLSGPNHAEEVARGILSATVVASSSAATAGFFQDLLGTPVFRVYTSPDVTGVQLCGAAKNIVAIAVGASVGVGFGDNTTAMIMTRGLAEISRLVTCMGGDPLTCMGLAGMGDLIATCTSRHSRNRSFGLALAQGESLSDYEGQTHMVVEGALACIAVTDLARHHGVEMPIGSAVRRAVWDGVPLDDIVEELTGRPSKPEFY